jgi:acyl carrier protein
MASTDTSRETIENVLMDALATMGPDRSEITRERTFEELDIDSLDVVEMSQIIEEKWGLVIDPEEFAGIETIGSALDLVIAKLEEMS